MSEHNECVGRDAFHAARNRRYHVAVIPGFGMIRIQSLTAGEKDACEAIVYDSDGNVDRGKLGLRKLRIIAACVVDADGHKLFGESDMAMLRDMDSAVSDAVYETCIGHMMAGVPLYEDLKKTSLEMADADSP